MSLDPRAVEIVTTAHKRQLALRFEVSALTAAVAAGHTTTVGQQAYALSWLAEYAAGRILELSPVVPPARGGTPGRAPSPQSPQGAAGTPTCVCDDEALHVMGMCPVHPHEGDGA